MIKLPPDWTFIAMMISFVLFWQLMRWVLFTPVQRVLAARAERMAGNRARAETLGAEAAALAATTEAALAEARRQGTHDADDIRRRAEAEEHAILARYRAEATTILDRERATTEAQVAAARAPLRNEAQRLAESVVAKLLERTA